MFKKNAIFNLMKYYIKNMCQFLCTDVITLPKDDSVVETSRMYLKEQFNSYLTRPGSLSFIKMPPLNFHNFNLVSNNAIIFIGIVRFLT